MASDANQHMIADHRSMQVKLWDLGPQPPEPPVRPDLPKGKEGDPEHDLAMIEFKGTMTKYEADLQAYGQAKKDFADWHNTYGGPYEFETYSVNAREAMEIEPDRYLVSDSRLPNHGLPKGRKPGKYHAAEQDRQASARRTFAEQAARDPVFGSEFSRGTGAAL